MLSVPGELVTVRVPLKPSKHAPVQGSVERGAVSVVCGAGGQQSCCLCGRLPIPQRTGVPLKVFKEKSYCMGTALQL